MKIETRGRNRKDKVRHSKYYVLSPEEVKMLIKDSSGKDKLVLEALIYGGLRASELAHLRTSWINIGNEHSKLLEVDHIRIPDFGEKCDCIDCQLQAFFELKRGDEKRPKTWYAEIKTEFYQLKKVGELPILNSRWTPKSKASARPIPILFNSYKKTLKRYFKNHDSLKLNRQQIWSIVIRCAKHTFGDDRVVYPHVLRATCASMWANSGIEVSELKAFMGWDTMGVASSYIKPDDRAMITATKRVLGKVKANYIKGT